MAYRACPSYGGPRRIHADCRLAAPALLLIVAGAAWFVFDRLSSCLRSGASAAGERQMPPPAFWRQGEPEFGEFDPPAVLTRYGEIPAHFL